MKKLGHESNDERKRGASVSWCPWERRRDEAGDPAAAGRPGREGEDGTGGGKDRGTEGWMICLSIQGRTRAVPFAVSR